jgi:hypothetical protein
MNAFATKPTRPPELVIAAYVHLSGVDRTELLDGVTTTREISRLRHQLMYLLADLTFLSRADIGHLFAGRTEPTVTEGIGRVADRILEDAEYRHQMQQLHAAVLAHPPLSAGIKAKTARDVARAVCSRPEDYAADTRLLAAALLVVDGLLSERELAPEDCLFAAQQALRETQRGAA